MEKKRTEGIFPSKVDDLVATSLWVKIPTGYVRLDVQSTSRPSFLHSTSIFTHAPVSSSQDNNSPSSFQFQTVQTNFSSQTRPSLQVHSPVPHSFSQTHTPTSRPTPNLEFHFRKSKVENCLMLCPH